MGKENRLLTDAPLELMVDTMEATLAAGGSERQSKSDLESYFILYWCSVSCFIWSGALDSSSVLLSCLITSLASL